MISPSRERLLSEFGDDGFTLFEVLITLAITSVASIAMFQTLGQLVYLSERSVSVSEEYIEALSGRLVMSEIVSGFYSHKNHPDSFVGNATEVSAKTVSAPGIGRYRDQSIRLFLKDGRGIFMALNNEEQLILDQPYNSGRFLYLGEDQKWHKSWPPAAEFFAPVVFQEDVAYYQIPSMPLAIKAEFIKEGSHSNLKEYIFSIHKFYDVPVLPIDLEE